MILQASAGARKYAGEAYLRHMVLAAVEAHPDLPVVLHQDHGTTPAVCMQSIHSGFTSVMMDGSLREDGKTPASYDYNLEVTRRVCDMAHAVGVSVEGELGCLGSLETGEAGEEDGVGAAGTLELPCITRCVFGTAAWICAMRSMARMSPVGLRVNL